MKSIIYKNQNRKIQSVMFSPLFLVLALFILISCKEEAYGDIHISVNASTMKGREAIGENPAFLLKVRGINQEIISGRWLFTVTILSKQDADIVEIKTTASVEGHATYNFSKKVAGNTRSFFNTRREYILEIPFRHPVGEFKIELIAANGRVLTTANIVDVYEHISGHGIVPSNSKEKYFRSK